MSDTVSIRRFRVFLSSPGDVAEERAAAREALEALQKNPLLEGRVLIDVVNWDDPLSPAPMLANLTPQDAVNRSLPLPADCDLTVVIMWGRMGTPLAVGAADATRYRSGTEWEYENARAAGKDVLLYRRTPVPQVSLGDPDLEDKRDQLEQVEAFFARLRHADGSLAGGFTTFTTTSEFSRRLTQDVQSILARYLARAAPHGAATAPPAAAPGATPASPPPMGDRSRSTAGIPATVGPAATPVEPGPIQAFLTVSGLEPGSALVVASCVVLEDPGAIRRALADLREDLLHSPQLRDVPAVAALTRQLFDFGRDDPDVQTRLIDVMSRLSFEAYAWVARTPAGPPGDARLEKLLRGLFRDRLTAERTRPLNVLVDRRITGRVDTVRAAVIGSVDDIRASDKRGVPDPTVAAAEPLEGSVAVARYVAGIVGRRLDGATPLDIRTFERFHPSKIRVVHELGTKRFYDRRSPLR